MKFSWELHKKVEVLGPVETHFFKEFLFVANVAIIHRCTKNGNHPSEDLAKFVYKPTMKYKSLIILLYFDDPFKSKYKNMSIILIITIIIIFSHLTIENFQNHFNF